MSRIRGHVDGVDKNGALSGWAIDEGDPAPCAVRVLAGDGKPVASGVAKLDRLDLLSLGYGRENFSFQIKLPRRLETDRLHVFVGDTELSASPIMISYARFDGGVSVANGMVTGIVGERFPGDAIPILRVEDQIGRIVAEGEAVLSGAGKDGGLRNFDFALPMRMDCFGSEELHLVVFADGSPFARTSTAARIRGCLDLLTADRVAGWLHSQDAPDIRFEIEVYYNNLLVGRGACNRPRNDLKENYPEAWSCGFSIDLRPDTKMPIRSQLISLRIAGSDRDLFDGPFLLAEPTSVVESLHHMAAKLREETNNCEINRFVLERVFPSFLREYRATSAPAFQPSRSNRRSTISRRRLNIVIPILRIDYRQNEFMDSVIRARDPEIDSIIIVDDTADPSSTSRLERYDKLRNVFILTNVTPAGFDNSVRRALSFCQSGHCIIVESHTRIFPGAFDEACNIARTHPAVGMIAAVSNSAAILSYPHPTLAGLEALDGTTWSQVAEEALSLNRGAFTDVPIGHWSFLFLRRELLDQIDEASLLFDPESGEESEMRRRAADLGWRCVAAFGVFVEHRGAPAVRGKTRASRGRGESMDHSVRRDPLRMARWPLDRMRLVNRRKNGESFVLVVRNWLKGGTDVAIDDLERTYGYSGRIRITLTFCEDGSRELSCGDMNLLAVFSVAENTELIAMLDAAAVDRVIVHQVLGSDEEFVADLARWVRERQVHMAFYIHDFYAVCQRVTMFDAAARFCRGADGGVCGRCVAVGGTHEGHRMRLAPGTDHRKNFENFMTACAEVVAPSEDTKRWMQKVFPHQAIVVRPHPDQGETSASSLRSGDPNQIIVLGAISREKGADRLLELARDARLNFPDIHFHVVGYTQVDDKLREIGNVSMTGRYVRSELPTIIAKIDGRIALFLHEWPETFSYTLSEAWSLGLWPVVPDIGAPAERVRARGVGKVLEIISARMIANEVATLG